MPAPVQSTRRRGGAAVVVSLSLAAAGLAAAAPGAGAVSASIAYDCTAEGLGTFTLPVVLNTDAPARMSVGQTAEVTITAGAVLPGAIARKLASGPATDFDSVWTLSATFGTSAASVRQTVPRTRLGDQSVATAVPFTATSDPMTYTAPATPGAVAITAGAISAGTWQLYDGEAPAGAEAITCALPDPAKPPVIDTIAVVGSSSTTLALDRTTSEYGQDVTASAQVTTSSGAPDGDVAFSVDGLATKARVDHLGVATLVLPDAGPGVHSVTATFVPRDPTAYDGSAAGQSWTVTQARTRLRVPVTGRTTDVPTRVGVKAKGVFDTEPRGKVRIELKRIGKRGRWIEVRTLDSGSARAGFGRLAKGRYRLVVVYRGDVNHLDLRKTKQFRVRRR